MSLTSSICWRQIQSWEPNFSLLLGDFRQGLFISLSLMILFCRMEYGRWSRDSECEVLGIVDTSSITVDYSNSYNNHSKSLEVSGAQWALVDVGGVTGSKCVPRSVPAEDLAWMTGSREALTASRPGAPWPKPCPGRLLSGMGDSFLSTGIWRLSTCKPAPDGSS